MRPLQESNPGLLHASWRCWPLYYCRQQFEFGSCSHPINSEVMLNSTELYCSTATKIWILNFIPIISENKVHNSKWNWVLNSALSNLAPCLVYVVLFNYISSLSCKPCFVFRTKSIAISTVMWQGKSSHCLMTYTHWRYNVAILKTCNLMSHTVIVIPINVQTLNNDIGVSVITVRHCFNLCSAFLWR